MSTRKGIEILKIYWSSLLPCRSSAINRMTWSFPVVSCTSQEMGWRQRQKFPQERNKCKGWDGSEKRQGMTGGKGRLFQQQHWLLSWDSSINKADTYCAGCLCFSWFTFIYFQGISLNIESNIVPFFFLMDTMAGALRMVSSRTDAPISAAWVQSQSSALWQGMHALLPHGDVHLLPLLPILVVYAIQMHSKYQGRDFSLFQNVSKSIKSWIKMFEGLHLFCKRSSTNWGVLSSHAHL